PRLVFDDHRLAPALTELLADGARKGIGAAACGLRHDDAHDSGRIILRLRGRNGGERGDDRGQTSNNLHRLPPTPVHLADQLFCKSNKAKRAHHLSRCQSYVPFLAAFTAFTAFSLSSSSSA